MNIAAFARHTLFVRHAQRLLAELRSHRFWTDSDFNSRRVFDYSWKNQISYQHSCSSALPAERRPAAENLLVYIYRTVLNPAF